jgi:hypothetical protein
MPLIRAMRVAGVELTKKTSKNCSAPDNPGSKTRVCEHKWHDDWQDTCIDTGQLIGSELEDASVRVGLFRADPTGMAIEDGTLKGHGHEGIDGG